jgi:hypothetical protein
MWSSQKLEDMLEVAAMPRRLKQSSRCSGRRLGTSEEGVPPRGSLQMLANRTRLQVVRHWKKRSGRTSSIAIAIAMLGYRQVPRVGFVVERTSEVKRKCSHKLRSRGKLDGLGIVAMSSSHSLARPPPLYLSFCDDCKCHTNHACFSSDTPLRVPFDL